VGRSRPSRAKYAHFGPALRFALSIGYERFYFAAELSSQDAGQAVQLLQSGGRTLHEFAAARLHPAVMFIAYLVSDRLNRQKYP
jgi:hypothetical protein